MINTIKEMKDDVSGWIETNNVLMSYNGIARCG